MFVRTSDVTCGMLPTCPPIASRMASACVTRNTMKIGTSAETDSFTPRRFITVRSPRPASAVSILSETPRMNTFCHAGGRKLKIASAPDAIEIVIVST
jgi:hypothetical protein